MKTILHIGVIVTLVWSTVQANDLYKKESSLIENLAIAYSRYTQFLDASSFRTNPEALDVLAAIREDLSVASRPCDAKSNVLAKLSPFISKYEKKFNKGESTFLLNTKIFFLELELNKRDLCSTQVSRSTSTEISTVGSSRSKQESCDVYITSERDLAGTYYVPRDGKKLRGVRITSKSTAMDLARKNNLCE